MPCLSSSVDTTLCTKPSSRRISASRSLRFERGHSTSCLRARIPFRIRDRKSAIGSVIDIGNASPARLDDARDIAAQGELTEAATAHFKFPKVCTSAAAALATALDANLELLLLGKLIDQLAHAAAPASGEGAPGTVAAGAG